MGLGCDVWQNWPWRGGVPHLGCGGGEGQGVRAESACDGGYFGEFKKESFMIEEVKSSKESEGEMFGCMLWLELGWLISYFGGFGWSMDKKINWWNNDCFETLYFMLSFLLFLLGL